MNSTFLLFHIFSLVLILNLGISLAKIDHEFKKSQTWSHLHSQNLRNKLDYLSLASTSTHPPQNPHPHPKPHAPVNHPKGNSVPHPHVEERTREWYVCLTLLSVSIAGVVFWVSFNAYMEYRIKTEGAMRTELGIRRQDLSSKQVMLLNMLTFNSKSEDFTKKFFCSDVIVKSTREQANAVTLGEYLQVDFTQSGTMKMAICNRPVNLKIEASYFEIEIDQIKQVPKDPLIGIGFISSSQIAAFQTSSQNDYSKIFENMDSVLYSSNGIVKHGYRQVDLHFSALSYGETLGIGFTKSSQRVWLTYNGEFLNPPSQEELDKLIDLKAKKKQEDLEEIVYNTNKDELTAEKSIQQLRKERVIKLQIQVGKMDNIDKIYPFIISNCACVLDVNVGGYPFRFSQKEIATGLLEK